ncbi:hypothetical protein GCM10009596_15080 [Arthrobacter rhombi]|uniref:hypothetical protein n=1 Tax=Arthrobacter rhombi TaxID=71253 RepID=UPI0031D758AD
MPITTITVDLDDDEYTYLVTALSEYRDSYAAKVQDASEQGEVDSHSSSEAGAIDELIGKFEEAVDDAR